ncbi:MAG: TrkH family potassium uptake protein, partial [Bacteroidales bacterium]|nr:TrkH family potassium uptake protein [Bacteroidales bacterium]
MLGAKEINLKEVGRALSSLTIIEGVLMLMSIPFAIYYNEDTWPITLSAIITIGVGLVVLGISGKKNQKHVGKREAYMIVSLAWVVISLFGTLPYIISDTIPNFTNAFFETISGFTTTGSSVINDIEAVPKNILFWRSMTHWIGGMGIIVLTLAIMPLLGVGASTLFAAESPGPTTDKLHQTIAGTAKRLWFIYVVLTIVETLLLWVGEMNFFDAICHSFATLATGGFSTKNDSIAHFGPYVQYVITIFMFLAGVSFTLHYFFSKGKWKKVYNNEEFRFYGSLIIGATIIIFTILLLSIEGDIETKFRNTIFQVVSITTTTGFVSYNYLMWPTVAWFVLVLLMFTGGSAGSTGGGIKMIRHLLLFKTAGLHLKKMLHPRAFFTVKYNGKSVKEEVLFAVMGFLLFYSIIFGIGTFLMTALG